MSPDANNRLAGHAADNVSPLLPGLTTAADGTIFVLGGTTGVVANEGAPFASIVDGNVVPVELFVWSGTGWRSLTTTTCGDGCITATLSAALMRASIVGVGRELLVAAAPLAVNGLAPGRADIVTDAVELRMRARR